LANKQQILNIKNISLQHRARATKLHIQNSTNHFSGIMTVIERSHCTYNPLAW